MSLYRLTDSESFWEVEKDTRCLIGWGHNTVVVAFRGTASMRNALADMQVRFHTYSLQSVCDKQSLCEPLCLTGWDLNIVVVAFRGTASMWTALADTIG